ncbi:MAG: hypothetical protein AVDCRST_MAG33-414 [uncultured Thermomicrobiales bacterium]|uniref:N-acetyltransferase domain-containing protein n=1 Tax=uncultured Thermomicrobiales bacterium TaxID=1645740 RepID=A0A6J4UCY0_9BACT|nr:MAG: hypothetical protein AVDCRST_MAG33-414 [uncultured Thermomicrobiales bacterium]
MTTIPLSIWRGPRVHLRAFALADANVYQAWDHDSDQARALWEIPWPRSPEGDRRWAEQEAERGATGDNIRLVIADGTDTAIGDITTHDCDPRVGTFSYGITIAAAHRGQGYATEALGLLFRYLFEERRYQKAWVIINGFNGASIALHERLGFSREGQLRRMTYTRGEYHDQLIYGLLREEWTARQRDPGQSTS